MDSQLRWIFTSEIHSLSMAKRRRVVVGVAGPTLPSPPSRSTPCRRRPQPPPRPQAPLQSASSHLGVNDVPPLAPIATQSRAIPVCRGAYLHGRNVQLPMSTQVPNTSEASPTPSKGLRAFQFGIPPPCTSSFLPNWCIPPCQPSSLQAVAAMLPPMPQINLIFLGSSNFVSFG